jgi:hypothetical protein
MCLKYNAHEQVKTILEVLELANQQEPDAELACAIDGLQTAMYWLRGNDPEPDLIYENYLNHPAQPVLDR